MDKEQENAVVVKDLYKSFRLPHEQNSGLKQAILNVFRRPSKRKRGYEVQHVLEDISFEIKKGEFFGIVGRNGSGKSTLLKLLAGIYAPDKGLVQVNGSLTPFIELGVGFNPELTGRENVYLNGALLGFSRSEMEDMYEDIVTFAELEKFMDQKLKNYSSGMQVRLAFSIAIRAKSDILLIDEVLAVGDEAFQRKCSKYFSELKRSNVTVILVTHDMGAVLRFCDKAMMVSKGKIIKYGPPKQVAELYSRENDEVYADALDQGSPEKSVSTGVSRLNVRIENGRGTNIKRFYRHETVKVGLAWESPDAKYVGVALVDSLGRDIFSPNTFRELGTPLVKRGITYEFTANITAGEYQLKAAIFRDHDGELIERVDGPTFVVENGETDSVFIGITELEHRWIQ